MERHIANGNAVHRRRGAGILGRWIKLSSGRQHRTKICVFG